MINCNCSDPACQFHKYETEEIADMEDAAGEEKYQAEKEESINPE